MGVCVSWMYGGCHTAGNGKHLLGAVLSLLLATLLMPPDSVLPTLLRNLELVLGKYQSSVFCLGQGLMPELLIGSGSLGMLFFCSNVWAECRAFCSLG